MNIKQAVLKCVDDLPNSATLSDIQYNIYVISKIEKAESSLKKHGAISNSNAAKRLSKWLMK